MTTTNNALKYITHDDANQLFNEPCLHMKREEEEGNRNQCWDRVVRTNGRKSAEWYFRLWTSNLKGSSLSIVRPPFVVNNFELKPNFIHIVQQMCQFDGFQDEDPYVHLTIFLELCDTFKANNVFKDAGCLRLFLFSMSREAKQWLSSLPSRSIIAWGQLAETFLTRYFLPTKITKLRSDISSYRQLEFETIYDTWERYKDMLSKCP